MNNSIISTANPQQLKWFVIVNFFPALGILIISEGGSSTLTGFAAFQCLYVFIIVKQCFLGSFFFNLTSYETGETLDHCLFAAYGFIVPIGFLWLGSIKNMGGGSLLLQLFLGYFIPLFHSYFYELLFQKNND